VRTGGARAAGEEHVSLRGREAGTENRATALKHSQGHQTTSGCEPDSKPGAKPHGEHGKSPLNQVAASRGAGCRGIEETAFPSPIGARLEMTVIRPD